MLWDAPVKIIIGDLFLFIMVYFRVQGGAPEEDPGGFMATQKRWCQTAVALGHYRRLSMKSASQWHQKDGLPLDASHSQLMHKCSH